MKTVGLYLKKIRGYRRILMYVGGLACFTTAAWSLHFVAGLAVLGLSFFFMEFSIDDKEEVKKP